MDNKSKVIIIGIDGGEYSVFNTMMRQGRMPNLEKIMAKSCYGNCDTYVDAMGQGWATFMTGKSPLKHNIFYWNIHGIGTEDVKGDKIWNIVNDSGLKVGVVNVSYTYPPEKVNGFFISGLGGGRLPSKGIANCYPDNLLSELESEIGEYIWGGVESAEKNPIKFLEEMIIMERRRLEATSYLMDKYDSDLTITVIRGSDAIQHSFWNYLDENHQLSKEEGEIQKLLGDFFNVIDAGIAKIVNTFNDASVMIIADHGFGPTSAIFNINEYLREQGFLSINRGIKAKIGNRYFQKVKSMAGPFYKKVLSNISLFRNLNEIRAKKMDRVVSAIDLKNTVAYADNQSYSGLRISPYYQKHNGLSEKEFVSKIDELIKNLLDLEYLETGISVVRKIHHRDELFGAENELVPELLLEGSEEFYFSPDISIDSIKDIFENVSNQKVKKFTGTHRRFSPFIAFGHHFKSVGEIDNIKLTDIMPTALKLLGLKVPEDVDGKVINDIIK
ncbi:MAG: alkaline phosphatase family protein [Desulfobacula sp.]|nr:alkaline phosphatase family protein [Desulfobacula sp.]